MKRKQQLYNGIHIMYNGKDHVYRLLPVDCRYTLTMVDKMLLQSLLHFDI